MRLGLSLRYVVGGSTASCLMTCVFGLKLFDKKEGNGSFKEALNTARKMQIRSIN